jgi:peptidyl-prolyl cis-trans isomerase B (cyclophilin B)
LFKTIVWPLTVVLALSAAGAGIEQLEQSRSLGTGRLAAYLNGNDRVVALRAALAIGRTKQAAGIPLLAAHTAGRDPAMRAMAVYGIGIIANRRGTATVLRALRDGAAVVRVAALDAVDRYENARVFSGADERAANRSTQLLLHDTDRAVRARAATSLEGFSAGARAGSALHSLTFAFASERDPYVREHIMWTLFRGYAKAAPIATLHAGLKDADEVVRIEAVRALGRRGDASQVAALRPLAGDQSWRVQEQTLESIKVLHGGKMTEHWTKIPAGIHTPSPKPDAFASLKALARPPRPKRLSSPSPNGIIAEPQLDPSSVASFTGPAQGPHPRVRIVTTQGNVTLELYPEWAPLTVENFLNLANAGYYDGNPWFRIVPDFVVQSGDPSATSNGPGYTTVAEENPIEQDSYVLAMGLDYTNPPNAHAKRDSAGSEFYITLSPQFHLNRDFSVFGRVIGGFDVLGRLIESDKIQRIERLPDSRS